MVFMKDLSSVSVSDLAAFLQIVTAEVEAVSACSRELFEEALELHLEFGMYGDPSARYFSDEELYPTTTKLLSHFEQVRRVKNELLGCKERLNSLRTLASYLLESAGELASTAASSLMITLNYLGKRIEKSESVIEALCDSERSFGGSMLNAIRQAWDGNKARLTEVKLQASRLTLTTQQRLFASKNLNLVEAEELFSELKRQETELGKGVRYMKGLLLQLGKLEVFNRQTSWTRGSRAYYIVIDTGSEINDMLRDLEHSSSPVSGAKRTLVREFPSLDIEIEA